MIKLNLILLEVIFLEPKSAESDLRDELVRAPPFWALILSFILELEPNSTTYNVRTDSSIWNAKN